MNDLHLHFFPDGSHLAVSDDGERGRKIAPDEPVPSGWHLLTEAEFREHLDEIIEGAYTLLLADPDPRVRHSARFRLVSTMYPHAVALAYGHDLERAAADSDEQVAARVAGWEQGQGIEPRDWNAIGAEEREEPPAK
jgi:hypothetical protein